MFWISHHRIHTIIYTFIITLHCRVILVFGILFRFYYNVSSVQQHISSSYRRILTWKWAEIDLLSLFKITI